MSLDQYLERGYLPDLDPYMTESELADGVLTALEPVFTIEREVWGTHCSGRQVRIDAVLRPRDPAGWFDDAPAFGLEFKRSVNQGAEALAQCMDYSHTVWTGYGQLSIFLCPAIVSRWAWSHTGQWGVWTVQRLMGQYGIGELDWFEREGIGTWFLRRAGSLIWDDRHGPSAGGVSSLAVKTGHRG